MTQPVGDPTLRWVFFEYRNGIMIPPWANPTLGRSILRMMRQRMKAEKGRERQRNTEKGRMVY